MGDGQTVPAAQEAVKRVYELSTRDGVIASLRQITGTRCWPDLAGGAR